MNGASSNMFPDDPLGPFLREMEKMSAIQREIDKTASLHLLGRMGSIERRVLEDALAQYKKIEEMERQLGGLGTKELEMWLEGSRMAKMIQGFRDPSSVIDFRLGLPKYFLRNLEQDRIAELTSARKHFPIDAVSAFLSSFAASTAVAEALNAARAKIDVDRMKSITEPWENAARVLRPPELSPLTTALASFTATRMYLPLIGSTVASQIVNHWRQYGVEQELRAISERFVKLLEDKAPSEEDIEKLSRDFARFSEKKVPDFLSILNLLLVLVIFWYQEYSSNQMEERLSMKFEAGQTQQRQRDTENKVFQATIIRAFEHVQPSERGQTVFVVRDRVALTKKEALPNAPVVGSLVPNQTAILLEEKGEWIRVEYFDWHSQSARQGAKTKVSGTVVSLHSLDNTDPEIDALWAQEAEDRLAAYDHGEIEALNADAVLAEVRRG